MKLKTSALALAVAGIVAAPMAVQAETYASVRIGLQSRDAGGVDEMSVRGYASRLGFKGETDLGNGMSGFGKYEFSVATEGAGNAASIGRRHALVGLKGDFGSVTLGQTYHTFYNHIVGPLDNPWWGSGYAMVSYTGRTGSGLSYAGDFGAVSVGVTAYMATAGNAGSATSNAAGDPENIDGTEIAVSFDAGPVTIGVGIQDMAGFPSTADPEAVTGIAVTGIQAGPVNLGISLQTQDVVGTSLSRTGFVIDAGFNNAYVHYESLDNDTPAGNPTSLTLGYTHSIGRQTTAWFEFQTVDGDDAAGTPAAASGDADFLRATLKYDIK